MSLAIDGLVSGLDTTSMITSLMKIESAPQTLLKNKVTTTQNYIAALQSLNTKVAALGELATKTGKPDSLQLLTATSTATSVTAKAAAGAVQGGVEFLVDTLAQSQQTVSPVLTQWMDQPAVLTFVADDGTATQVTAASASLDDVVKAVNASGAGVSATKVDAGGGGYRIQFTSAETGAAGSFDVYRGAQTGAPKAKDLLTANGGVTTRAAQDASVTLWAGTTAARSVTSSTNTFDNLLTGVAVTVSEVSAKPVSVTVGRDEAGIAGVAKSLVDGLNEIFALVDNQTKVSATTDAAGNATTRGGILTGDSTVRDVDQRLLSAATAPVDGRSPSSVGISITKSGTITYDADRFAAALKNDPVGTQTMVSTIASRVATAATASSDKYTGQITMKITGQKSEVRVLGDQVEAWDRRLETRRSTLERTYSALEVALSRLNSQSSWLSGQLATLNTGSSS
jgi:flagellar hook-associated protein 2